MGNSVRRPRRSLVLMLVAGLLSVACSGGDEDSAPTSTRESSTTSASTSSTTTSPSVEFPPDRRTLEHGGSTWAVVLAGADEVDAPEIMAAVAAGQGAGYELSEFSAGDCDVGAAEALGLSTDAYTISLYYWTDSEARQALAAFEASGYQGAVVAEVQTYCLD